MKVLKFGGTSVADSQSLSHVVEIIKNSKKDQQIVVVSALGGITNILLEMAEKASKGKTEFQDTIKVIEKRHLTLILHFIPVTNQSEIISFLKSQLNSLEEILESIYNLRELTPYSIAKISSFGEILSSKIIFHILQNFSLDIVLKDSRELLFTHELNDREVVNHERSKEACNEFASAISNKIILIPGFIASNENGKITTLGRGGSDYVPNVESEKIYVNQAIELIEKFLPTGAKRNINLIGYSAGGAIASMVADKLENCASLILLFQNISKDIHHS